MILRLNLLLLAALVVSALYLVRTQYESRRLYGEIEKSQALAQRLEVDNERLQVEKRAQATPARVERMAREALHMRTATPAITQYVTWKGATVPGPAHQREAASGNAPAAVARSGQPQATGPASAGAGVGSQTASPMAPTPAGADSGGVP